MTRKELIEAVYFGGDIPLRTVEKVCDKLIANIKRELIQGGEVNLLGFGKFSVKTRPAREGRNPRTGEPIQIPESKLPYFTAGKAFKEAVR